VQGGKDRVEEADFFVGDETQSKGHDEGRPC
jgi:hypothetical protein